MNIAATVLHTAMKKVLVWLLIGFLVASLTWLLGRQRAGKSCPNISVQTIIYSVSAATGAEVVELRVINPGYQTSERGFAAVRNKIDRSLGRTVYGGRATYRILYGESSAWVTGHQTFTETGRIEIAPQPGTTGFAADLKAALLKAFPDLRCKIVAP